MSQSEQEGAGAPKRSSTKIWLSTSIAVPLILGFLHFNKPGATVSCKQHEQQAGELLKYACDVQHTGGFGDVRICWTLQLACPDGRKALSPNQCETVVRGETKSAVTSIHATKFQKLLNDDGKYCEMSTALNLRFIDF